MRILHYSLGLPRYRSGGLTKYSYDLMKEQVKQGDTVCLLFPGNIKIVNDEIFINKKKDIYGIYLYELINPLPVPLLNGICNPNYFMKKCDKNKFILFLREINVEVVHIHTFMGLYKEFLEACKELNIKILYTTHDYFGLCTKVNFIDYSGNLCNERNIEKCILCNSTAYSLKKMIFLQSSLYRFIKNKGLIDNIKISLSYFKKYNKNKRNKNKFILKYITDKNEYNKIIEYYKSMFNLIDYFLFNSNLTKQIYSKYLNIQGEVIHITHADIKDNRVKKFFDDNHLRFTYLGPFKEYKGFYMLSEIMSELQEKNNNIILNIYGDYIDKNLLSTNIKNNGKYLYKDLKKIFNKTDILVVPSICNETFGFITLEALSYGVPVLLTDRVGSKDLVLNDYGKKGIVISCCKEELKKSILELSNIDRKELEKLNENILNDKFNFLLGNHYNLINNIYSKIIRRNDGIN